MELREEDVIFAVEKAQEIAEQYRLYVIGSDGPKKSIDDLAWLFKNHCGKKISLFQLNLSADELTVRGMYAALKDGSYEIYILAELGGQEERFVLCKELSHVLLDVEDCRNMNLYEHLEEAQSSFSLSSSEPNCSVAWEFLAEVTAMEFLFPYKDRVAVLAAAGANPDYAEIARRYGVPQVYVENYLSSHMMAEFAKIQDDTGATRTAKIAPAAPVEPGSTAS